MKLPVPLLDSLSNVKGFDREAFEKVHALDDQVTSIRINPLKGSVVNGQWSMVNPSLPERQVDRFPAGNTGSIGIDIHDSPFTIHEKVPWTQYGYYLHQRPSFTFDPLFHAGCYYVQEASSMFLEQALSQTVDLSRPLKVLDLCAAPGGKSTHLQSLISTGSLLVSNEVIRSRANILKDNIIKWGCRNVVVTNNDPKELGYLENYFDVIVVDAPCSGSGLFRREPEAIGEWSLNNVKLCSQRQQRILAGIWPALKTDGILIYATCSYSKEEDEKILDWMMEEFQVMSLELSVENNWNITVVQSPAGAYGYRCWPDKVKGEGFFISCIRKTEVKEEGNFKTKTQSGRPRKKEIEIIEKWVKKDGLGFVKHLNTVYAWPANLENDLNFLLTRLRVIYSGILVGELIRDKLVPDHALALSGIVNDHIPGTELTREQAIDYLKKKDLKIEILRKGWQLATYHGYNLGWMNVLATRINNYYPGTLRILKEN